MHRSQNPHDNTIPWFMAVTACILVLALSASPGCLSTETTSTAAESLDSLGVSLRGLRESNIRMAYSDGLTIEQAADSIIRLAADQQTKLHAQLWKIYSIPVIRQTYGQSDPLLSVLDALAFSMQCEDYFTSGLGKDRFGPYQQIAINAVDANRQRLEDLNSRRFTATRFDSIMTKLSRWVAKHPLTNHVFERPSVLGELDAFLGGQDHTIGSAVGRIAEDVDDLSGRLSLLAAQLPREARWQGEYMITDLALEERLEKLDTTIAVLTASLAHIEQGLTAGTIVVDIASLQSLHSDIQSALTMATSEREIVLAEVERIRLSTLAAAEEAVDRSVSLGLDRIESIVDRLLLKLGIGLTVAIGAVAIMILFLRRVWQRKG